MDRKLTLIFWILSVFVQLFLVTITPAADYPIKPINLYVGFQAGGAVDTAARIVTNQVNKYLEQPVIVVNKAGGASAVAADFVAKSKPDGYTLLSATITTVIHTIVNPDIPFKLRDFMPIAGLYSMPLVIVVKGDSKLSTIEEFIDFAKKNPKQLNMGIAGVNVVHHFAFELFKKEAGIEANPIVFQGDPAAVVGVLGGHIDFAFLGLVSAGEHIKRGTMKGLVVTSSRRSPQFPNIPTMGEKGFAKGGVIVSWGGVFAPAGTPMAVLEKLSAAYQKATANPDVVAQLEKVGFAATYMNAKDFDHFVKDEQKRLTEIAQSAQMIKK